MAFMSAADPKVPVMDCDRTTFLIHTWIWQQLPHFNKLNSWAIKNFMIGTSMNTNKRNMKHNKDLEDFWQPNWSPSLSHCLDMIHLVCIYRQLGRLPHNVSVWTTFIRFAFIENVLQSSQFYLYSPISRIQFCLKAHLTPSTFTPSIQIRKKKL